MKVDIDKLTEAELVDLNNRIIQRLRLLQQMRAHTTMLEFSLGERVCFQPDGRPPGRVSAEIYGPNVRHSVIAVNGQAAFILCASLVENREMEASFSTAACIRILDVVAFADMVSRHILGFVGGFQGNCVYREDTTLRKQNSQLFAPPSAGEDPEKWAAEHDRFVAKQTTEGFFYKRLEYAHQFARCACPTRNSEAPLLAAYARR